MDYTFDTTVQGWSFSNFQGAGAGQPVNLAVADAGTVPTLTYDASGIDTGSLKITVTFTDYNQIVDPLINFAALDITGHMLHAKLRLESGTFPNTGFAVIHASSTSNYIYANGTFSGGFSDGVVANLVFDPAKVTATGWDVTKVVQLGVQIGSGGAPAGDAGPFPGPVSLVFHLDTVTD